MFSFVSLSDTQLKKFFKIYLTRTISIINIQIGDYLIYGLVFRLKTKRSHGCFEF